VNFVVTKAGPPTRPSNGGAQRLAYLMERFHFKDIDVKDLPARMKQPVEFRPSQHFG
jgi:hypothetical protein